jgi:putative YhbY family RNA-binding protein
MAELTLERDERLALRAQAHHLDPVVLLGNNGLSEPVLREIDRALSAHGLIKVRVPGDDREQREAWFAEIAERLSAGRVAAIGKLLVLFRPVPEEEAEPEPTPRPRARTARTKAAPAVPARSTAAKRPGTSARPAKASRDGRPLRRS